MDEGYEHSVAAAGVVGSAGCAAAQTAIDHAHYCFDLPTLFALLLIESHLQQSTITAKHGSSGC